MNNWNDEFSSYDIDLINAKVSAKAEGQPAEEEFFLPMHVIVESQETELEPKQTVIEQVPIETTEMADHRQKVKENKDMYEKMLVKVGKHPRCVTKEDVEKAIAQLDECITATNEPPDTTQQDVTIPTDRRQLKRRRILNRQITDATDVYIAAKCIGRCFIDLDQAEYYKHLGDRHYLMMTSMAARTFRERWPATLKSETAQQAHDSVDKILVSAQRLAKSLAETIDAFPGEGGMMELLNIVSQKCDEDEFNSIGHALRMAGDIQELKYR